jgi:phage regulator Rha-like protein
MELQVIKEKIYEVRGQKVMLDFDLAELYEVETKVFNQAVKRNIDRFPEDFMFQLTEEEWRRSQFVTASEEYNSSQIVISSEKKRRSQNVIAAGAGKFRNKKHLPYAFTEHGVSMLASVLRSEKAVQMSIAIVRAFIALKQYAVKQDELTQQIRQIVDRLDYHDVRLDNIYQAIEGLLNEKEDEKEKEKQWIERERIGYKK